MERITISIILAFFSIISCFAQKYTTIYTKGGQAISVAVYESDLPDYRIKEMNDECRATFPNATILSSSTVTYNCHSYAWNLSDGGSTICWIDQTNGKEPNLSKYWTDDYYFETTEQNAVKVFYYNSDHSAIVSPTVSGMYESKWGAGPLMRHAPGYGPYLNMNERKYYSHTPPSVRHGLISCSNGVGEIRKNIAAYYYADFHYRTATKMVCAIETGKGDDAVEEGYAIINETSGQSVNVTFTRAGIYEMNMRFYDKFDFLVAEYRFEPLVID